MATALGDWISSWSQQRTSVGLMIDAETAEPTPFPLQPTVERASWDMTDLECEHAARIAVAGSWFRVQNLLPGLQERDLSASASSSANASNAADLFSGNSLEITVMPVNLPPFGCAQHGNPAQRFALVLDHVFDATEMRQWIASVDAMQSFEEARLYSGYHSLKTVNSVVQYFV